ncbi:methyl-accepting chemotaxis protein [Salidesulfovibrio onnuriiensis]|uniref:methyl-accepting chemotaxis protein n=1 Tax=Salidesulfovibrio onnuriiensis TaxID=2583823 RepID=UPI001650B8F0|nr:cache domain-containing protein [Salidesulfovibrio onnuriiensis]
MKISIKVKIIAGLLIPIICAVAVIFFITAYNIQKNSMRMFVHATGKELLQIDSSLTLFMDEAKRNTTMMALDDRAFRVDEITTNYMGSEQQPTNEPFPGDTVGAELRQLYKAILKSHAAYKDAYIGTKNGGFIIGGDDPMPTGYDPRERPWYKVAVATPDKAALSEAYESTNGEAMVSTGKAIVNNGQILGVAAMDISLGSLTNRIKAIKLGERGFIILIQDDGKIIANPKDEETNFKNVEELGDKNYRSMFNSKAQTLEVEMFGKEYVANIFTSPGLGWKFVGMVEMDEIMAPVYSTLWAISLAFLVSLVIIVAFIWIFIDLVAVKPLQTVVGFLGDIGSGKYDGRVEHSRGDEIGVIFTALNDMSSTLEDNIKEITAKTAEAESKARAAELATAEAEEARLKAESAKAEGMQQAAYQLEAVVEEVNRITEVIAQQANEIRNGTDVQRDRIQTTATAMEEMNATVLEVARNASDAAAQGQEAKAKAMNGADVVNQSVKAINSIEQQASELKANMGELDEKAKDIGNIMSVITDIAD